MSDSQSITNGWDAICALDSGALTQLLFQAYLEDDPTARAQALQIVISIAASQNTYGLVDLMLGPPELAFPASVGSQQAQLSRFVLSGWFITFDAANQIILSATPQQRDAALSGVLDLSKVQGEQGQVGQLVLDFGSGAWTPALSGLDPVSTTSTDLGAAILAFYQSQSTSYPLGTIATSTVPAGMQPSDFLFVTAQAGDGTGATSVQLLIQTTGSGGPVQPLASYPIPSGSTAALILSNQLFFDAALPAALNAGTIGTSWNASASGQSSNGAYQTQVQDGQIALGVLGAGTSFYTAVPTAGSSTRPPDEANVNVPFAGTFAASGGNLQLGWQGSWNQAWSWSIFDDSTRPPMIFWGTVGVPMGISMTWNGVPAVASGTTNLITFADPTNPFPTVSGSGSAWDKYWSQSYVDEFQSQSQGPLQSALGTFPSPDISTFALDNLLFPSQAGFAMQFEAVTLPFDLVITGQLPPTLSVTQSPVQLTPGQTFQLAATFNGSAATVTWEAQAGSSGTVDASGLYTAPAAVNGIAVDVITATLDSNTAIQGGALILVAETPAATTLVVSPPAVTLTPGQGIVLTVTDGEGNIVAGPAPAIPAGSGTITAAPLQPPGVWLYTAPDTLSGGTTVDLTFQSSADLSDTGSAAITLVASDTVTVTASPSSVTAGQEVQLSASADTLEFFEWILSPAGVGTLSGEGATATYTAPATITAAANVTIIAYAIGPSTAGIGLVTVQLTT
jgi:hypothetical protein